MTRKIALILTLIFMLSMVSIPASAMEIRAPRSSDYITGCSAIITEQSSTTLKISFTAKAKDVMSKLGASTIYLFCDGKVVASYTLARYPSMSGSNVDYYTSSVTYTGASSGHTYYAQVFFQAKDADGSGSDYCYTSSITL